MTVTILQGDCRRRLAELAPGSVNCIVTSPPYFNLRDYDQDDQIGLEETPDDFVAVMVEVFELCRRALADDGTLWLNLGDSYAGSRGAQSRRETPATASRNSIAGQPKKPSGSGAIKQAGLKPKDLMGVPWRVAFALQAAGWWLRDAIVWAKPNGMPGSQQDRCTSAYEMVLMLSKSADYWSDFDAIKTPPRESTRVRLAQDVQAQAGSHRANGGSKANRPMKAVGAGERPDKQRGHGRRHAGFNDRWDAMSKAEQQSNPVMMRDVWFISPASYSEAHFAVMPDELARRCILAGCPEGGGGARSVRRRRDDGPGRGSPGPQRRPDRVEPRVRRHG